MKGINLDKVMNLEKDPANEYIKEIIDYAKRHCSEMIFGFDYIEAIENYKRHFSGNPNLSESDLIQGENQLINAVRVYNSINRFGRRN